MNIAEIGINLSDLVSEDFDRDEFIFRFIEIYNAPKSTLDKLRKGTQNKADLAGCQSALKFDPLSAFNIDPFIGCELARGSEALQ